MLELCTYNNGIYNNDDRQEVMSKSDSFRMRASIDDKDKSGVRGYLSIPLLPLVIYYSYPC
jgi:hypothetical protein